MTYNLTNWNANYKQHVCAFLQTTHFRHEENETKQHCY